jgi:F-type H+-transporting ATPase subunit alpha
VDQPLQSGLKCIDAMIPVGRGQRELIIGDRQTGKTAMAMSTPSSRRRIPALSACTWPWVRSSRPSPTSCASWKNTGAMAYTIVVAASASESPASMQFLAPYSGCTMGEYFRDRGQDALIIYDDLSKQAVAYRQISCCCAVRRDVKPIPATCSISTAVCWSAPLACPKSMSRSSPTVK